MSALASQNLSHSWKYITPIDENSGIEKIEYLCSCSYNHTFIHYKSECSDNNKILSSHYQCKKCSNEHFVNYNRFIDATQPIYSEDFIILFDYEIDNDKYIVTAYTKLLTQERSLKELKRVDLASLIFDTHELYNQHHKPLYSFIHRELINKQVFNFESSANFYTYLHKICSKEMVLFIKEKNGFIKSITDKISPIDEAPQLTIRKISFFMNNRNIEEAEVWYFKDIFTYLHKNITSVDGAIHSMLDVVKNSEIIHTHPKSVKKAIYKSFKTFDEKSIKFDYIILNTFFDHNYTTTLLSFPNSHKKLYIEDFYIDDYVKAVDYLKNIYSEKQIFNLFKSSIKSRELFDNFKDSLRMVGYILDRETYVFAQNVTEESIIDELKMRRVNIKNLHAKLIYISNYNIVKKDYTNTEPFEIDEYLKMEVVQDKLSFKVAKTPQDLAFWGSILHNCLSSYAKAMYQKRSIIFSVSSNSTLLYAIEIRGGKISQALGKYNREICEEDMLIINQWFNENYFKLKSLNHNIDIEQEGM